MSAAVDPHLIETASMLAGLPPDERARAWKALRTTTLAQVPDDELVRPPVRSLGEYLDAEIENPPYLVGPGLLVRGGLTAMIARAGKGKTTVTLNRIARWALGKPLFDTLPDVMAPVGGPVRTLIIENEGAPGHFQRVLRTIVGTYGEADQAVIRENVSIWGSGGWSGLKLDSDENVQQVAAGIVEAKADLVFLEPFRGLWRGNENDSTEMIAVMDSIAGLAEDADCAFLITHHEGKNSTPGMDPMSAARGSTVLEGFCGVMERWRHLPGGHHSELSWIKARYEDAPAPVRMAFKRETWGYDHIAENDVARRILGLLSQFPETWFDIPQIMEALEEEHKPVWTWARRLAEGEDAQLRKMAMDGAAGGKWRFRYKADPDDADREPLSIS